MKDERQLIETYFNEVLIFLFPSIEKFQFNNTKTSIFKNTIHVDFDIGEYYDYNPHFKTESNDFVHFTSLKSLMGILNDRSIRMTSLSNLNDPNEYQLYSKYSELNDFQINIIRNNTYIFSLCERKIMNTDEILNLWRLYGENGNGCAIIFEIEDVMKSLSHVNIAKVIYDEPNLDKFLKANSEFKIKHNIEVNLENPLKFLACLYKKKIFKIENEVRLFWHEGYEIHVSHLNSKNSEFHGYDINSRGDLISFHKIKLFNKELGFPSIKIKEIQFGFKLDNKKFEILKEHIEFLFYGMNNSSDFEISQPVISKSPLLNEYI